MESRWRLLIDDSGEGVTPGKGGGTWGPNHLTLQDSRTEPVYKFTCSVDVKKSRQHNRQVASAP